MTSDADDAELAAMMVLGSRRAFDLLYARHAGTVRRLGMSFLGTPEAADDLVQDTFLELWGGRATYSSRRASVRTWLLAIARHRAIDVARARSRQARLIKAVEELARIAVHPLDPPALTILRDEIARLHAALEDLPSAQRRTVVLAYGGGLTHVEVAQRIGVPLGTVKSRLRLGRQSMARALDPERVEAPFAA